MSGRIDLQASIAGSFTLAEVEERLVEAMLTCWRHADRERGWQRLRSAWPEITRDVLAGDYDDRGGDMASAVLRPASLTRREVGEMEEAFGWVEVLAPIDRKLVGLAVSELARGQRQVRWALVMRQMGLSRGRDGLRMRYGRAMARVCQRANARTSERLSMSN
ncbi:hypothetical protein [Sphingomonas sp.]|uniref:hypothetical protein n=1 Tax=Sphingomonas sp. TaxID=28214 RepID=UPI002D7E9327|nr:hypothetical protein [Sphingomonas sp.]HEU0045093.1 hypothetical protein [Sphingomonas sp.]